MKWFATAVFFLLLGTGIGWYGGKQASALASGHAKTQQAVSFDPNQPYESLAEDDGCIRMTADEYARFSGLKLPPKAKLEAPPGGFPCKTTSEMPPSTLPADFKDWDKPSVKEFQTTSPQSCDEISLTVEEGKNVAFVVPCMAKKDLGEVLATFFAQEQPEVKKRFEQTFSEAHEITLTITTKHGKAPLALAHP